jgi:hypothetical protein
MNMDNQFQLGDVAMDVTDKFGKTLTKTQLANFKSDPMFGAPISVIQDFLNLEEGARREQLKELGIPLDSIDGGKSEFQEWVKSARGVNSDIKVAIKADKDTPYKIIKRVMNELQDIDENRYYLITSLKTQED